MSASPSTPSGIPTLVVVNARVWTGDPRRPWATALAAAGARLVAVGSSAEMKKLVRPSTRVIDARGMLLLPASGDADRRLVERLVERLDATMADGATPATLEAALRESGATLPLARGGPADFALIDRDLTAIPRQELREAQVVLAVVGGVPVYERDGARPASGQG